MKQSISFLTKISKNNNTEWMHAHKSEYVGAKEEFEFLVQELIVRISSWDKRLPHLEPKSCIFRLNRDVRFSDNKKPYKDNFGAYFAYGGKKGNLPGYYLHLSPKEIFVAGGIWMPEASDLIKIRRYISRNGKELEKILNSKAIKGNFGELNTDYVLKRPPKGFSDDPFVELLKFKSFTLSKSLNKKDALAPGFGKLVDKNFKLLQPFNEFMAKAILSESVQFPEHSLDEDY